MKELVRARKLVQKHGILMVYPLALKTPVPSLWEALYPGVEFRWDWDSTADPRVAELWHIRRELSESPGREVAYVKWLQGRATFFSIPVLRAILSELHHPSQESVRLPQASRNILDALIENSPQSTREIRQQTELSGKAGQTAYAQATKALWSRFLIVGVGEVQDSAFPSLAMAATETWFEDCWNAREDLAPKDKDALDKALAQSPAFSREYAKSKKSAVGVSFSL